MQTSRTIDCTINEAPLVPRSILVHFFTVAAMLLVFFLTKIKNTGIFLILLYVGYTHLCVMVGITLLGEKHTPEQARLVPAAQV